MTLKKDARFEEKLTLGSKNDMRNLVNFNANGGKSENLYFDVLLLSIPYKVSVKKCKRIISHDTEKGPKFEEKLTFCLKNDMKNLVNFKTSNGKSENLHFDGLLLSKIYKDLDEKVQKSYFS